MQISSKWVAALASVTVAASGIAGTALTSGKSQSDNGGSDHQAALRLNQIQQIGAHNSS